MFDRILKGLLVSAACVAVAAPLSCNHAPVEGLEKSLTLTVTKSSGTSDPIKIDFLWVIDNSSSMCDEQVSLSSSFTDFTAQLGAFFQIDPRVAVTTVDAQCDIDNDKIFSSKGVFNAVPATKFPPPCQQNRIVECFSDTDCGGLDCEVACPEGEGVDGCTCPTTEGEWTCRKPTTESCLVNPNGTVNSSCRRRCGTDEECQTLFGDARFTCQKPSSNSDDWGCVLPPPTEGCPATVPAVLDGSNLDLFPCLATVGVNQEKCLKYEQGMRSALMALDPAGPNPEQAAAFLRPDAYLVVIFVSDEDDCSVAEGENLDEAYYETCALQPTTDQGGKIVPVGHYVNRFKGMKSDPGRVIVATISGDSVKSDLGAQAADREAFTASKGDRKTCYHQTYICLSDQGKADYGARYLELAQSFGPNGVFTNICNDEGIAPALDTIAETIIKVLNKVCLPRLILDEASLVVERRRADGLVQTLTPGRTGPGTYALVRGAEDCAIDDVIMPAISFGDPPTAGEEIIIKYQGDPLIE